MSFPRLVDDRLGEFVVEQEEIHSEQQENVEQDEEESDQAVRRRVKQSRFGCAEREGAVQEPRHDPDCGETSHAGQAELEWREESEEGHDRYRGAPRMLTVVSAFFRADQQVKFKH